MFLKISQPVPGQAQPGLLPSQPEGLLPSLWASWSISTGSFHCLALSHHGFSHYSCLATAINLHSCTVLDGLQGILYSSPQLIFRHLCERSQTEILRIPISQGNEAQRHYIWQSYKITLPSSRNVATRIPRQGRGVRIGIQMKTRRWQLVAEQAAISHSDYFLCPSHPPSQPWCIYRAKGQRFKSRMVRVKVGSLPKKSFFLPPPLPTAFK